MPLEAPVTSAVPGFSVSRSTITIYVRSMCFDRSVIGEDSRFAERDDNERGREQNRDEEKHIIESLRQGLPRDHLRQFALQNHLRVRGIGREGGNARDRVPERTRVRMGERLTKSLAVNAAKILQPRRHGSNADRAAKISHEIEQT